MVAAIPPSAELPALYRAVLDGVAILEGRGHRATATAIRRQAIAAYAAAWDDRHRNELLALVERVRREIGQPTGEEERPADARLTAAREA